MVFYFKARPEVGDFTIFMGLDKHENEELIKYGFPEDIWLVPMSPFFVFSCFLCKDLIFILNSWFNSCFLVFILFICICCLLFVCFWVFSCGKIWFLSWIDGFLSVFWLVFVNLFILIICLLDLCMFLYKDLIFIAWIEFGCESCMSLWSNQFIICCNFSGRLLDL